MLPDSSLPWPIPMRAVALIAEREGCRLRAYRCPAGKWTCGWGETEGVTADTVFTQAEADQRFCQSLTKRSGMVNALCKEAPTPNQLGALTSLAYNIGIGGFEKSTVLKRHNAADWQAAARAFGLWNKARVNGVLQVMDGLTSRRLAEAALYLTPDDDHFDRMPQAIEAESKASTGPIVQGGAVAVGAGVLEGLQQWGSEIGGIKPALDAARSVLTDTLGVPPSWILPIVLIGAGALVVRWRLAQRREGWA